jgi:hypothetical protein
MENDKARAAKAVVYVPEGWTQPAGYGVLGRYVKADFDGIPADITFYLGHWFPNEALTLEEARELVTITYLDADDQIVQIDDKLKVRDE